MRRRGTQVAEPTKVSQSTSLPKEVIRLGPATLVVVLVCWLLAVWADGFLPTPKAASVPPTEFSEERARGHLQNLLNFGVRTVGSVANEVNSTAYILSVAKQAAQEAQRSGWSESVLVEVHHPSGAFSSDFLGGFTNVYDKVTNVVVYVPGSLPNASRRTVLINAHFDSPLGSPAASDDGVMIANMLELLQCLVRAPPLPHAVVFNFNGAEETNWMAAHGFITQHRWRHQIRAMINLEGAGAGGREMVIQTGPKHSWIAQAYAHSAPYPHGHTLGQIIFQSGIIPGDTDFQVYRDYGGESIEEIEFIPGIDMVAISQGHIYHTSIDDMAHIQPGAIQRTGENIGAVLRNLASSPLLVDPGPHKNDEVVFFDILGFLMVVYTQKTALVMNMAALLLFTVHAYGHNLRAGIIVGSASVLTGFAAAELVAILLTFQGLNLHWYSLPALGCALYTFATATGAAWCRYRLHSLLPPSKAEDSALIGALGVWVVLMVLCMLSGLDAAYICLIHVAPLSLGRLLCRFSGIKPSSQAYILCHIVGLIFPCIMSSQYILTLATFVFPLMGRIGTEIPVELLGGAMLSLPVSICLVLPMSAMHELPARQQKRWARLLLLTTAALFIIVAFRFPYDANHPKRIYLQHISREWHSKGAVQKQDSGVWINSMDYRNLHDHLHQNLPFMLDKQGVTRTPAPCEGLFCSFPWYFPIAEMITGGIYIPANKPPGSLQLDVVKDLQTAQGRTLSLRISGPTHMALVLGESAWTLRDWSFGKVEMMDGEHSRTFNTSLAPFVYRRSCRCYFLFRATGNSSIPWEFDLIFSSSKLTTEPLQLVIYGHELEVRTAELREALSGLPEWVTPVSFLSLWQQHLL